ncbi:MAG: hypothetical protein VR74_09175 [Hyphomonas sp. BRH_c22]|nr:MAG: hypothetical protein VR74_09175 [Hyphomonas sp. BRH_c22]
MKMVQTIPVNHEKLLEVVDPYSTGSQGARYDMACCHVSAARWPLAPVRYLRVMFFVGIAS